MPARCLMCEEMLASNTYLCDACRSLITPLREPMCDICGTPGSTPGRCLGCLASPPPYDRLVSAAQYDGLLKVILHGYKYKQQTIYSALLAELMLPSASQIDLPIDILTFVPLHWSRAARRGYNQSALLAKAVARRTGMRVHYDVLRKGRRTQAQVGLSRREREQNLRGSFTARGVEGKSVMVVDDVITSGSTAREVARTLKRAGASRVVFVSVGRTLS